MTPPANIRVRRLDITPALKLTRTELQYMRAALVAEERRRRRAYVIGHAAFVVGMAALGYLALVILWQ